MEETTMAAYRIRDVIREEMDWRGHSVTAAEAAMGGMPKSTLYRFLGEQIVEVSKLNCARIAAYLEIPEDEVRRMVQHDARWIRARRVRGGFIPVQVVEVAEDLLTWWGEVQARPRAEQKRGCKNCEFKPACRQAVDAGRPLPCEQFLVREVLAPHEREARGAHV